MCGNTGYWRFGCSIYEFADEPPGNCAGSGAGCVERGSTSFPQAYVI